jgi:hypothetical protein
VDDRGHLLQQSSWCRNYVAGPARSAISHPAEPATWAAVRASLAHHDQLATLSLHIIVTNATRAGQASADGSYPTRRLAPTETRLHADRP